MSGENVEDGVDDELRNPEQRGRQESSDDPGYKPEHHDGGSGLPHKTQNCGDIAKS